MSSFKNLNTPCVFIGNHMSSLETMILPAILLPNRNVVCVVYKGILRWPIFKDILPSQNPIVVSKTSPREDLTHVLSKGHKALKQDVSVIVFPQGARMTEFRAEDFSSIGVKLAKHAEVPVLPIAIKSDAWGNDGFPIPYFGKIDPAKTVRISFGEPLYISGTGRKEHDLAVGFIKDKLTSWGMEEKVH
jgi:1-acyl-sn-glycerol-3-phosphate acyltransferase